jgi:hypothetical protein
MSSKVTFRISAEYCQRNIPYITRDSTSLHLYRLLLVLKGCTSKAIKVTAVTIKSGRDL